MPAPDHASGGTLVGAIVDRPAASASNAGVVYISRDQRKKYRSNGSAWEVVIDQAPPHRRIYGSQKTPGTGATLTDYGGSPVHTLSGTASNLSDTTGHYVQLSATAAKAGVDIAATECVKTQLNPIVTFAIKTGAVLPLATERLWIGIASDSLSGTDSPTGKHVLCFRYAPTADTTAFWRCVSNGGSASAGTVSITAVPIAVSTRYILTIDATNPASVDFYINGIMVATHAANLPTTTKAMGTECITDDVSGGSTKEICISTITYETN